jgi:hypothetical protein
MDKPTKFFVEYNAKYIAEYKSIRACLNFIKRKGLHDDCDNCLCIWDNRGVAYNSVNGKEVEEI